MKNIKRISDLNASELKPYTQTSEKMLAHINEPKLGYFVAESPNVIIRALTAGYEPVSFLVEKEMLCGDTLEIVEKYPDIPIYVGEHSILKEMIGYPLTRGILALMKRRGMQELQELMKGTKRIAVLEDVMNPTNVGAIFRSAAALSVEAVLLTKGCSDPLYRRAARVSMGTVFQIPWTWITIENWHTILQENGFRTVAMALTDQSISLRNKRLLEEEKLAILFGTEGEGLKPETIRQSDYTVKIPMAHGVDSLNVAAASAVAFWQLCQER